VAAVAAVPPSLALEQPSDSSISASASTSTATTDAPSVDGTEPEPPPPPPPQPPAKKQKMTAEQKKHEKERRLNRVGLSYRCGRCGMPKKGHVCIGGDGAPPAASKQPPPVPGASPGSDGSNGAGRTPPGVSPTGLSGISPTGGWDLDSESIFKDIKSVLQTPAPLAVPVPPPNKGSNGKASSKRSKANSKMPPPALIPAVMAEKSAAEKSQLLEELDIAMQRPPSVITPDDGDGSRGGPGPASLGPSSMMSASDMFSPGQLMTHLLGTPTPAITPGLSPGTLNELGNMLQSPAPPLSAQGPPSLGALQSPAVVLSAQRKVQEATSSDGPQ